MGEKSTGSGEQTSGPEVKTGVAWVGTRLKRVQYTLVDGQAVVEGCIVLGEEEEIAQITRAVEEAQRTGQQAFGVAITDPIYRWPNRTVPFDIDSNMPRPERITEAIQHWRDKTSLRFVERTGSNKFLYPNWVTFRPVQQGCSSRVGCRGGQQFINVGPSCTRGNVIHEVGHAVGLFHEQSREDRDEFVEVHLDRVPDNVRHNFNQHIVDGTDVGPYDYASIMHYPRDAFTVDGSDSVVPKNGAKIGQRDGLSDGDIATIRILYP